MGKPMLLKTTSLNLTSLKGKRVTQTPTKVVKRAAKSSRPCSKTLYEEQGLLIEELERNYEELEEKLERKQTKLKKKKAKLERKKERLRGLETEYQELLGERQEREEQLTRLEEELKDARSVQLEKDRHLTRLGQELEDAQKEQTRKDECIQKLEERIEEAQRTEKKRRDNLQAQLFEMKKAVATSTSLNQQWGDELFHRNINRMYMELKECLMDILSSEDVDIKVTTSNMDEFLAKYVPDHGDNTEEDRLDVCIAVVSDAIVGFVAENNVFGTPREDLIKGATQVWNGFQNSKSPQLERVKKQWLTLTSQLLAETNQENLDKAREGSLNYILDKSEEKLRAATTLQITESIRKHLASAISPCMETLRMLYLQEWQFTLEMIPAHHGEDSTAFDPMRMEGMFGEKKGFVKASCFPLVGRVDSSGDQTKTGAYGVICKAKVNVKRDKKANH